jgi:hypothetical protein
MCGVVCAWLIDGLWIGWLVYYHLIQRTRDCRQCSAIADLHILGFTVTHALGFSNFTSRILTTALSQSHCKFKSHPKSSFHRLIPFLPVFGNCQFRRLDSVEFLYSQPHILAAGVSKPDRLFSTEFFFIITLHEPRRKHSLNCWEGVFAAHLHSNRS